MYETKYRRYITHNSTRFAEKPEIISTLSPIEKGAGVPLFADDGTIYVDDNDNHSAIIGPTGCGKTRIIVLLLLFSLIRKHESIIVNDPKGELFRKTSRYAKKLNYHVKVLNLRRPNRSNSWNPLALVYNHYKNHNEAKALQDIDDIVEMLMSNTHSEKDVFWENIAGGHLSAILKYCLKTVSKEEYYHFKNVLELCYEQNEGYIREFLENIDPKSSIAAAMRAVVDVEARNTKSCIYSVLLTGINSLLKNDILLKVLSGNNIRLEEIPEYPTIIYVIYPDEKNTLSFLINLFYTQCYRALCDVCERQSDDKLPIRTNFVLDEFSNLCSIEGFENRISMCRSKNIRYHLFIQSMAQLEEKYKDTVAQTILSNCSNWICFSSKEEDFLQRLSKLAGTITDYNGEKHDLISSSEIQYLRKGKSSADILFFRAGVRPYVAELPYYDCTEYYYKDEKAPLLPLLMDSNYINIAPYDWIKKIVEGEFKLAYPKPELINRSNTETTEKDRIQKELENKFDQLFGSDEE